MAREEVQGFPALRPHQRPAWHMFLVQLGALALWTSKRDQLPTDAGDWTTMLRKLSPEHPDDEPWRLVVTDPCKPAFLQAPETRENMNWDAVQTPDALDMLITSRNHDVKQAIAKQATAEDWIYALVSLQTCEGYGGRKNCGIARMNGGSSSRPMLGLAPSRDGDASVNPSAWWVRDVQILIKDRMTRPNKGIGTKGGHALLWCLDWPEGEQLDPPNLDPWFIEICRRVRLLKNDDLISAKRGTSKKERIDAKSYKGNLNDPWAPIEMKGGKSLTLSSGNFDYMKLNDLLFSGNWKVPLLAQAQDDETSDMLLVAEAFSRGNAKTEGFKSCVVPVPGHIVPLFSSDTIATLAKAQINELEGFNKALRYAIALAAAHGVQDNIKSSHYSFSKPATKRLNHGANQLFFLHLWQRTAAHSQSDKKRAEAKCRFLKSMYKIAKSSLEATLPTVPCPTMHKMKARIRARRAFFRKLRKDESCRDLFNCPDPFSQEKPDVAA